MTAVSAPPAFPAAPTAWRRRLGLLQDALLVVISALFFISFARHAVETRSLTNVFFAIEQGLLVFMFLSRRRSYSTSNRVQDWVVATVGAWGTLLLRPHESGGLLEVTGSFIQLVGLTCAIVGFATLGRSFGVVAANRGLKVGGPYRLVRHPIYMAHFITLLGVVLANFWWFSIVVAVPVVICQLLRIAAEERVLSATSDYDSYKEKVRWRLVPGLY